MSVLSDITIKKRIAKGRLSIVPFDDKNLTPNGYDLTIGEIKVDDKIINNGDVDVSKGDWFAISTKEYISMPDDLIGLLWVRTTWARKGIICSFGVVDAGFEGVLMFSAYSSKERVTLSVGERFAQIVFLDLTERVEEPYNVRSGRYFRQRGINI